MIRIIQGDCREVLRTLSGSSAHCCVTSPPYFGLRDYGAANQIGLEATPDEYVRELVGVMREVRHVLRSDGTLWLNLGDSYHSPRWPGHVGGNSTINGQETQAAFHKAQDRRRGKRRDGSERHGSRALERVKAKDLLGIPWMVAFALRDDGWFLRQDIIWHKPNPMPESVRDRCTKSHEYIFLLSKSERYYYDIESIAEPVSEATVDRMSQSGLAEQRGSERVPGEANGPMKAVLKRAGNKQRMPAAARGVPTEAPGVSGAVASGVPWEGVSRNKRSVWSVTTVPFKDAHFATFPPALIEPCILAGCPRGGRVLDPFAGAGTTGLVADRLQRNALLIEINPEYVEMARKRCERDAPLFAEVESA